VLGWSVRLSDVVLDVVGEGGGGEVFMRGGLVDVFWRPSSFICFSILILPHSLVYQFSSAM
jgi:hypothetical protein